MNETPQFLRASAEADDLGRLRGDLLIAEAGSRQYRELSATLMRAEREFDLERAGGEREMRRDSIRGH